MDEVRTIFSRRYRVFFFLPSFTTETGSSIDATVRVSPFVEFLFFSFVFLIFKMFFLAFLPFLFRFESKECFSRVFIFFVAFFISVLFLCRRRCRCLWCRRWKERKQKTNETRARFGGFFFCFLFISRRFIFGAPYLSRPASPFLSFFFGCRR